MATKYLDSNGLLYLWQKIRTTFVSDVAWDSTNKKLVKKKKTGTSGAEQSTDLVTFATVATSGSYTDLSDKPTIPEGVVPASATPLMDANSGAVGTSPKFAREEHAHPRRLTFKVATDDSDAYTIADNISNGISADFFPKSKVNSLLSGKVDTVSGKGLSTNDFTDALQTKLNGIATGAEVNVQANWTESSSSSDAYIKNKPTLGTASGLAYETSLSASADNKLPTSKAVATYVGNAITGAASFQGTAPTTFAPTNYKKGWYWVVGTAGTYVGETCEAGDMIFAIEDYSSAYSASDFEVIQTNLDITSISNGEIDTIVAS